MAEFLESPLYGMVCVVAGFATFVVIVSLLDSLK